MKKEAWHWHELMTLDNKVNRLIETVESDPEYLDLALEELADCFEGMEMETIKACVAESMRTAAQYSKKKENACAP